MKKRNVGLFTMLIFVSAFCTNLFATDYLVSGAGSEEVNGTYVETGIHRDKPYYVYGDYILAYRGCTTKWKIVETDNIDNFDYYCPMYKTVDDGDTPPTTGWTTNWLATDPAPSVIEASPSLTYSANIFNESHDNDGSIRNVITITHNNFNGETFTGSVDDVYDATKVVVSNVPNGLTAQLVLKSSTEIEFSLIGNATAHENANEIDNLTVAFQNPAFSSNDASAVSNSTKSDLKIDYIGVLNVPATYGTIAAAIAAADDFDTIQIAAGTYTEAGLSVVGKSLTFKGDAANTTIVQAASSYNTASNRVFTLINGGEVISVCFQDLTIRYGKIDQHGGGIYSGEVNLEIYRCNITHNIIDASSKWGGGVYATQSSGYIVIEDCLIEDNSNSSGDGGGLYLRMAPTVEVKNTTIIDNSATDGGGIYCACNANLINCTITENSASSEGGGVCFNGSSTFKNSIIYDNTCSDGKDFNVHARTVYAYNSIIGSYALGPSYYDPVFDDTDVSTSDPLLSSLADNGGPTYTCALQTGSPAINAGLTGDDIPTTDQRGYRAIGIRDIGAFEYDGYPYDFPSGEGTDLGDGTTLNPSVNLDYAADQTIPEIPNGSFTADHEFVLAGAGVIDITITTSSTYGAYHQSGMWHSEQNSGGAITFTGVDFDAKGDVPIILGDDNPLPVVLSTFTAIQTQANYAQLNWTTQSETNNAFWNIYRADKDDFTLAKTVNPAPVEGQGNTTTETNYTFTDETVSSTNATYWYWLESVSLSGESNICGNISIEMSEPDNPTPPVNIVTGLHQNYPNPFNPDTKIQFAVEEPTKAKLSIFNQKGQKVITLFDGIAQPDQYYNLDWNGQDSKGKSVASGLYFYKLETDSNDSIKKMLLIK